MSVESDLEALAEQMEGLLPLFERSSSLGKFLPGGHAATFKRLALEANSLLSEALDLGNTFSMNLVHTINEGSGGFFGSPSYNAVREAAEILRGAVNHIRRQPGIQTAQVATVRRPAPFVDPSRLAQLRSAPKSKWDLSRLAQMCAELNIAHENDSFLSMAMLGRAIIDHVPPIFGCASFREVANNYAGASSFKKSMAHLDASLRNIADAHLHVQVRAKESLPTPAQVNFGADLDVLLAEIVRIT